MKVSLKRSTIVCTCQEYVHSRTWEIKEPQQKTLQYLSFKTRNQFLLNTIRFYLRRCKLFCRKTTIQLDIFRIYFSQNPLRIHPKSTQNPPEIHLKSNQNFKHLPKFVQFQAFSFWIILCHIHSSKLRICFVAWSITKSCFFNSILKRASFMA